MKKLRQLSPQASMWLIEVWDLFKLIVQYVITGFVLGIPYTWLTSGGNTALKLTVIVSPLVALLLHLIYKFYTTWTFGGLLCWATLPISINAVSHILDRAGLQRASDFLFEYRYHSLWIIPLAISLVLFLIVYPELKLHLSCERMKTTSS